jgi:ribonuclease P protein component
LNTTVHRQRLPKAARVLARRDFLLIQQRGKRQRSSHFVVMTMPAYTSRSRLGLTVTRRFGNAVARNLIKRRLREFFRARQTELYPAQDIVIIPQSGAETLAHAQVAKELERIFALAAKAR